MPVGKNGFGMREMLIWMAVLLVFLFLASYFINSLYSQIEEEGEDDSYLTSIHEKNTNSNYGADNSSSNKKEPEISKPSIDYDYYYKAEERMEKATEQYFLDGNYDVSRDMLNVSLSSLVNLKYMDPIKDELDGATCIGYSNVINDGADGYIISSFIKCSNYTTKGY